MPPQTQLLALNEWLDLEVARFDKLITIRKNNVCDIADCAAQMICTSASKLLFFCVNRKSLLNRQLDILRRKFVFFIRFVVAK